jgi:hypothetical protein
MATTTAAVSGVVIYVIQVVYLIFTLCGLSGASVSELHCTCSDGCL